MYDSEANRVTFDTAHFTQFDIDTTAPAEPVASPAAGDYTSDQSVALASSDTLSGVDKIYYTTDGTTPDNTKTEYIGTAITVDRDMTIKAIAYDKAGNASSVLSADYGIAPVISAQASSSVTSTSTTITWTTDDPATSRVIYDTVSHPSISEAVPPNYGYASSTATFDEDPKVLAHSVDISGLTVGTTYYYRTVSHGSPEAVGDEKSFATTASVSDGGGGDGAVAGASTAGASAPVCGDTKPAGAPTLLSATAGTNSVILTWSEGTGPVSYYLVTFGTSSGAQTYGNPNIGGVGTTSYTVSGLTGGTTYYFRVRAGNGCAPGDYSGELSATPTGGFVAGIPAGFAAGVLGAATEETTGSATPSAEPTAPPEDGEILGAQNGGIPWWVYVAIAAGLTLLVAAYFLKKNKGQAQ